MYLRKVYNMGIINKIQIQVEDASSLNNENVRCELYKLTAYVDGKKFRSIYKKDKLITTIESFALSVEMDILI
jgi:hypothetical protein